MSVMLILMTLAVPSVAEAAQAGKRDVVRCSRCGRLRRRSCSTTRRIRRMALRARLRQLGGPPKLRVRHRTGRAAAGRRSWLAGQKAGYTFGDHELHQGDGEQPGPCTRRLRSRRCRNSVGKTRRRGLLHGREQYDPQVRPGGRHQLHAADPVMAAAHGAAVPWALRVLDGTVAASGRQGGQGAGAQKLDACRTRRC